MNVLGAARDYGEIMAIDLTAWDNFNRTREITLPKRPLLRRGGAIFTMGTCFAADARVGLAAKGFRLLPDYASIAFDPSEALFGAANHYLAYYDTFTIRQEFESAFGLWTDRMAGAWNIRGSAVNTHFNSDVVYQEPSRRLVFAPSLEKLRAVTDAITETLRAGIEKADIILLSCGLAEVWRNAATGRYICRAPTTSVGAGVGRATLHESTFAENYTNVKATLALLFSRFPNKQVVMTVSAAHLYQTFAQANVGIASVESKSILRAVLGQIVREYPNNVTYFPVYEMAAMAGSSVYQEDGQHVLPSFTQSVVDSFVGAFVREIGS